MLIHLFIQVLGFVFIIVFKKKEENHENNSKKGKIDSISMNSVYINGFAFKLNKINKLSYKKKGATRAGTIFLTSGGIITIFGVVMMFEDSSDDYLFPTLQRDIGVVTTTLGAGLMATGITFLSVSKKYDLINKWKIKTEITVE